MRFFFSMERHSSVFGVDAGISSWTLEVDCFLMFACLGLSCLGGEVNFNWL